MKLMITVAAGKLSVADAATGKLIEGIDEVQVALAPDLKRYVAALVIYDPDVRVVTPTPDPTPTPMPKPTPTPTTLTPTTLTPAAS